MLCVYDEMLYQNVRYVIYLSSPPLPFSLSTTVVATQYIIAVEEDARRGGSRPRESTELISNVPLTHNTVKSRSTEFIAKVTVIHIILKTSKAEWICELTPRPHPRQQTISISCRTSLEVSTVVLLHHLLHLLLSYLFFSYLFLHTLLIPFIIFLSVYSSLTSASSQTHKQTVETSTHALVAYHPSSWEMLIASGHLHNLPASSYPELLWLGLITFPIVHRVIKRNDFHCNLICNQTVYAVCISLFSFRSSLHPSNVWLRKEKFATSVRMQEISLQTISRLHCPDWQLH